MNTPGGALSPVEEISLIAYIKGVEQKLKDIDQRLDGLKPRKKDFWEKFQATSSFLSGIIVLLATLLVTNRIDHALKERQLQTENVKDMQTILAKLSTSASTEDARNSSLTLAAYGRYAIPPFIEILQNHPPEHRDAAMAGLRAVGATDPKAVCDQLSRVLKNRTRLYHFEVHQSAAQVLGDMDCKSAIPVLQSYVQDLGAASPASAPFTQAPGAQQLTKEDIDTVKGTAEASLRALQTASD